MTKTWWLYLGKGNLLMNRNATKALHISNLGAFGGAIAHATWASWPLRGYLWVLKYQYCPKMITQHHPRGNRRVTEKNAMLNISVAFGKSTSQRIYLEHKSPNWVKNA